MTLKSTITTDRDFTFGWSFTDSGGRLWRAMKDGSIETGLNQIHSWIREALGGRLDLLRVPLEEEIVKVNTLRTLFTFETADSIFKRKPSSES